MKNICPPSLIIKDPNSIHEMKFMIEYHKQVIRNMIMFIVCLLVFNTTFNNMSAISWQSVLLVEEPGEN